MKIFISYSRKQSAFVGILKRNLHPSVDPWLDTSEISEGEDFVKTIEATLKKTEFFIIIIDHYATKSPHVRQELEWAIKRENETKTENFIIPIILDEESWKQIAKDYEQLKNRVYFTCLQTNEEAIKKIANDLSVALTKLSGKRENKPKEKKTQSHDNAMIDQVCDRMSEYLIEILSTAVYDKWEALPAVRAIELEEQADVKEIWTLVPNFESILGFKKETVVENVCTHREGRQKKYNIIFPTHLHDKYNELISVCKWHDEHSAINVSGKCLMGRHTIPHVDLVICFKDTNETHSVKSATIFLYLHKAPRERRVLEIPQKPEYRQLQGPLLMSFGQLWKELDNAENSDPCDDEHHHH